MDEPGVDYANLKNELIKVYEKSHEVRAREVMAIHSMGDKSPEGLLRHMKKLLPNKKDQESVFFKIYWLEAMPENIRDALFERDDYIDKLAEVAEKIFRKKKASLSLECSRSQNRSRIQSWVYLRLARAKIGVPGPTSSSAPIM